MTAAMDEVLAALKRLAGTTGGEYPGTDERHPDNDGTNEPIEEPEDAG